MRVYPDTLEFVLSSARGGVLFTVIFFTALDQSSMSECRLDKSSCLDLT